MNTYQIAGQKVEGYNFAKLVSHTDESNVLSGACLWSAVRKASRRRHHHDRWWGNAEAGTLWCDTYILRNDRPAGYDRLTEDSYHQSDDLVRLERRKSGIWDLETDWSQ